MVPSGSKDCVVSRGAAALRCGKCDSRVLAGSAGLQSLANRPAEALKRHAGSAEAARAAAEGARIGDVEPLIDFIGHREAMRSHGINFTVTGYAVLVQEEVLGSM